MKHQGYTVATQQDVRDLIDKLTAALARAESAESALSAAREEGRREGIEEAARFVEEIPRADFVLMGVRVFATIPDRIRALASVADGGGEEGA